jgi:hypothetical protein
MEEFRIKLERKKAMRESNQAKGRRSGQKRTKDEVEQEKEGEDKAPITVEMDGINYGAGNLDKMKDELQRLFDDAKTLIDLRGKLLVFLEPPDQYTWAILKPILSHDAYEIEHPYVHDSDMGFKVNKVVTIGWPACIFCSAKNELSSWSVWPEIQSRFMVASPNMEKEKYSEGNKLTAQKMGLPSLLQQDLIISNDRVDLTKKCVSYLLQQIRQCCRSDDDGRRNNPVWIPYANILGQVLPADKGSDNRTTNRIFSFLSIIALARAHLRCRLEYGSESLAIADVDDLREVLSITQNLSGIPPFKLRVFREVFLPLYKLKQRKQQLAAAATEQNKGKEGPKGDTKRLADNEDKGVPKSDNGKEEQQVDGKGMTTREVCDYYKEKMGKTISTDSMKKTYLNEFLDNDLIDEVQSKVHKRQNIYYPLVDLPVSTDTNQNTSLSSNLATFDEKLQHPRLIAPKNFKGIPENWLELEILTLLGCRMGLSRFGLFLQNGEQVCICRFLKQYFSGKGGTSFDMFRCPIPPVFTRKDLGTLYLFHISQRRNVKCHRMVLDSITKMRLNPL